MKHLDAVVAGVGDGDHQIMAVHVVGQGDALRRPELAVAAAGTRPADLEGKGAVWMKHLDAVVAGVGDIEGAVLMHGDALRRPELARAAACGVVAYGRHGLGMGGARQRRRGQQERRRRRNGGAGKQRHGRTAARDEGHASDGRALAYKLRRVAGRTAMHGMQAAGRTADLDRRSKGMDGGPNTGPHPAPI